MPKKIQRLRHAINEGGRHLLDREQLGQTIDRLVADGDLPSERAASLRADLDDALPRSQYVLKHLGAHLGIGAVFAFDVIPLPLGTVSRVLWVVGSRIYESLRGTPEQARIHSLGVFLIAAIPLLGYGAYLLPLRRVSEQTAYLYANHVAYTHRGQSLARILASKPRILKRLTHCFVPVELRSPHGRAGDDSSAVGIRTE